MSWFVGKFNMYCSINDTVYLTEEDFANIANEIEVNNISIIRFFFKVDFGSCN